GSGRTGRAGARRPPRSPQASAVLMAWAWLVLALFWRRESGKGTPAGRLSGGLRCCVRPMPICIVCAECLPVRNGKPSGASFDCDLLKHGQHKPRPSKGWSVGPLMLVGLPPHKRTDVGAVGIRRSGVLLVVGEVSAIPILGALASSPLPANMEASRAAGDGLHPRPSAPGGTHTGGCLRGVWALGAGRGKAAPPQPPSLGRPHGLGVACVGLVLAARVRRGTPVGRLSGGLRCCVRPMPICIVCAECLPVRNGKPSGACFDCDLLKHGQHKPRPSKGWSVGPLMLVGLPPHKRTDAGAVGIRRSGVLLVVGEVSAIPILGALASSPLPANMEASRAAGDGLHPRPSAPGGTHTGRVWSSSSSVARDPEISSTWLAKCRQSRHARLPHGSWGMLLGALASSPSPAKVEASHRQVGPVPRFLLLGSQLVLRPESSCLPGHAWACLLPFACRDARMRRGTAGRQHPPQAASVVGPSALLPWPRSVSCAAYPSRRHSIVPNVPFSPCAAPLGAAARGGPQGARCVPRPAHGRTCPGRWPIASSPDLSDAEHTVGTRPRPLFAPKASVRRFVRTTPATVLGSSHAGGGVGEECYLVDPASSHMLVSKIKPCIYSLFDGTCYSDNRSNSRANTCNKPRLLEGMHLLDKRSTRAPPVAAMIHDNSTDRTALVPATHHSNFCPINFRWVRFRRGSLRNGYHIQGRQQARKLPNPDTGSNGTFSTASAWEAIRVASPRRQLFTDIWHRSLRPTVSVFLWRLFQDWIPVDERMKRKGFSFASKCQCCEAEESISHLFVEGEVVREVWLHFANVFGLQLCETGDLVNLVHFWRYSTPFHSDLHIRTLVPFLILWSTWTQRNAAKYHGAHFTATGTILEVQRHLRTLYAARIMTSIQWKGDLHRALAMGFCFRPIAPQAPRVVRWSTPSPAWFKLNSDGSSLGNPGPAAAAGIIRDADGQVRLAYQFALGTATSVVSELTAVWRGLELARAHSLAPIVVEVDATVVLQLLQSRASGIWEVQHLIMRIVQLQQELGSDVRHIFREANGAADHLAKDAASRQLTRVMYQEDITGVLRGIIRLDKMGTPYLRRWTLGWAGRSASGVHRSSRPFCRRCAPGLNWPGRASGAVTLKKLECSKQAYALYTLAWDNIIGFRSYYVGLRDRTFAKDVFINQERKLGARRRSDTVLVSTINDADQGSADVAFRTPPAPYEKSKSLGSGGSMVARLKLKGIDGRAPPGVEPAA
ncbi:UNVERIFIED_CONTAM: hypothetical protein Sindi_2964600, partial [Sesamum indicum]